MSHETSARRLLGSLGGSRVELDPALERLLRSYVESVARRYSRRLGDVALGIRPEDVSQRVFLRLLEKPPDRPLEGESLPRLFAWVRVVTNNLLRDLVRRRAEGLSSSGELEVSAESSEEPVEFESRGLESIVRLLLAEYPLGAALVEMMVENPNATSSELASKLGVSRGNLDQIRSRMRRVLRAKVRQLGKRKS